MACSHTPITGASDSGFLCFCVCVCEAETKPKCPNIHLYNLHFEMTGVTVTETGGTNPADSMEEVLLSMHEVTSDYFIWKRPRLPSDLTVGNVTIKTDKTITTLEGGCTSDVDQGPSKSLVVKYISITTDTDKLVYEWDGTQLTKTSGTGRIDSIASNWVVVPAGGADLCCMPRKVVRRIWEGTETVDVRLFDMDDGSYDTGCAGDAVKPTSCQCYNNWQYTSDSSSFSNHVDGYYLAAHFEISIIVDISGGGPCGEVIGVITPCFLSCDPTANLTIGPVTIDFGPDDSCRTTEPKLLFNARPCDVCACEPTVTPNKIESPVNYTHLTDCCESGAANYPMCPDTGEGWTDTCCPTIVAYLGCRCLDIPESLSSCDEDFPFPTCPVYWSEWRTAPRYIAPPCTACACTNGTLQGQG